MKELFPEYYPIKQASLETIWKHAIVVPDTNVLLHLIRYRKQDADILFQIFENYKNSLWLPYQVAQEYHRHKEKIIIEIGTAYERYASAIDKAKKAAMEELRKNLSNQGRHPLLDVAEETSYLESKFDQHSRRIESKKSNHPSKEDLRKRCDNIANIFKGQVGKPLPYQDDPDFCKRYHERLKNEIPPGFKDYDQKDIPGDVILWEEMILYASEMQRPIVFVSDDVKDDWWERYQGQKIGPRPELKREFKQRTGMEFLIYTFENFLSIAGQEIKDKDARRSLSRVKKISKEERKDQERVINYMQRKENELAALDSEIQKRVNHVESIDREMMELSSRMYVTNSDRDKTELEARYANTKDRLRENERRLYQLRERRDSIFRELQSLRHFRENHEHGPSHSTDDYSDLI